MAASFTDLNLHPQLVQAVSDLGYVEPTPIQSAMIPLMLAGQDVIGQAQTGTGKTAAFALPILHNLYANYGHVQALVLAPTRELALQVATAVYQYGQHHNVRVLAVYGGSSYSRQITRLQKGIDVVVGTPGRIMDLMRQKVLDLQAVRTVVLDEADEMLSMGFVEDIETILKETPDTRQTALFSATMPAAIRRLADQYLHEPQSVTIQREQVTVEAIEQRYYLVNESDKLAALTRLFEMEDISSALIFARTRASSGELANELTVRGFPAEVLNGDLPQEARERVLNRFRQNQVKVLVATDVAARGLDIDDISHVFNFGLPDDDELYVHRIGRTGRAGKSGIAITLISPAEQWRLRRIEAFMKQRVNRATLPSETDILNQREKQLLDQVGVWLGRGRYRRERELVEQLVEQGHDPLEIAAAALKLARADEKQRPIEPVSEVRERQPRHERGYASERGERFERNNARREERGRWQKGERRENSGPWEKRGGRSHGAPEKVSHEAGMVRLSISRGRTHGIRPNEIVSSIAFYAEIPGHSIGKIYIEDSHTLIDVPEQFVEQVLAKTGNFRIHRQPVTVERA